MQINTATRDMLLAKEGLASLIVLALLAAAAAFYPLEPVGTSAPSGHADAPWLFLGLQELLRRLPAYIAGLLIPLAALMVYAALPWLSGGAEGQTPRWRRSWGWGEYAAWLIIFGWAGLTIYAAFSR